MGVAVLRVSLPIVTLAMREGINAVKPVEPLPADARIVGLKLADRDDDVAEILLESSSFVGTAGNPHTLDFAFRVAGRGRPG